MSSTLTPPVPGQPYSLPLPSPEPSARPAETKPVTPEQRELVTKLINHFNEPDFKLPKTLSVLKSQWKKRDAAAGRGSWLSSFSGNGPHAVDSDLAPLDDVERCYCSEQHFHRVCRAVKWDYHAALKRAEEITVWRREAKVEEMSPDQVSIEGETGKELIFGYDKQCRPVLYMHPYRQNTETGPRQIDFVIWCLERAIDLCPPTDPPTETLCLCIDFGASKKVKSPPTSLGQAKKVLDILQTYYCERLGRAVCVDIPGFFWAFYKLVGPFVDPRTKEKIRFMEKNDATELIPPNQLQKIFGGEIDFEYDHSTYFTALNDLCMERKRANQERWRQYGDGKCGLSEAVIRGAIVPDQASTPAASEARADEEAAEDSTTATNTASPASTIAHDQVGSGGEMELKVPAAALAQDEAMAEGVAGIKLGTVVDESAAAETFVDAPVASAKAVDVAVSA